MSDTPLISVSRVYADVNLRSPTKYYQYDEHKIEWNTFAGYNCKMRLGRGKYSDVFLGTVNSTGELCVIKLLKPVKKRKVKREIHILSNLHGCTNIVKIVDLLRDEQSKIHAIVFEHLHPTPYSTIMSTITSQDISYYIYQLLLALDQCHSRGIIHRDVKPQNLIINHETKQVRLIDLGLAEYYMPGTPLNVRVASRHYKGPELLVNYQYYDYSLDIWSLGLVLAGLVFKKDIFFCGHDNFHQLEVITQTLGTDALVRYLAKYRIQLSKDFDGILGNHPKRQWTSFINDKNRHLASPVVIDLIDKMLQMDHEDRPTAQECMSHPYFYEVHSRGENCDPFAIKPPPSSWDDARITQE